MPHHVFPEVRSTSEIYGYVKNGAFAGVPISGVCSNIKKSIQIYLLIFMILKYMNFKFSIITVLVLNVILNYSSLPFIERFFLRT